MVLDATSANTWLLLRTGFNHTAVINYRMNRTSNTGTGKKGAYLALYHS